MLQRILLIATSLALCLPHPLSAQAPPDFALLVVTKQSHALAIVDAATLKVVAQVPIGEDPHEVIIGPAPDNRTAFSSPTTVKVPLHTIAAVDLVAHKPLPAIDISPLRGAHGLALHNDTLWFTAGGSLALATLDPATRHITSVLGTGQNNTHLVWVSRDGNRIVASNADSGTLSIFNRIEIKPSVVPGAPAPPASYTTSSWTQTLILSGKGAEGFSVSPDERTAWVGDAAGTISLVDLASAQPAGTIKTYMAGINRLRFTPDGKLVLITTHTGKELIVFDAEQATRPQAHHPHRRERRLRHPGRAQRQASLRRLPSRSLRRRRRPRHPHHDRQDRRRPRARRPSLVVALNARLAGLSARLTRVPHPSSRLGGM